MLQAYRKHALLLPCRRAFRSHINGKLSLEAVQALASFQALKNTWAVLAS
jgi:hypothetical protein